MSFWLNAQFDGTNSMHMLFISQVLNGHIEMMKWLMIFYFAAILDATKLLVILCYKVGNMIESFDASCPC